MTQLNEGKFSRTKKYLLYLIIILILVAILDSYTTNFKNVIPSKIQEEFLYPLGITGNAADSVYSFFLSIASLGTYAIFIFLWLSDKIGRKIFLIIAVLGMGLVSVLLNLATNIFLFMILLFFLHIFFNADIQIIYISEECPPEKRARYINFIFMGSVVGTLLVPIFRSIFITETSPIGSWRGMTLFPLFLCIPLSIIIFFTIKESSKYEEVRERLSEESKKENLKAKFKTIFSQDRRKQYITLITLSFFGGLNYILILLGEDFLSSSPYFVEDDINTIVTAMALSIFIGYLITGIVADKFGRKKLMYIYALLVPISRAIFVFGAALPEGTLLIVLIGAMLSNISLIGFAVLITTVTLETLPTESRGTGSGFRSLFTHIGTTTGLFLSGIITAIGGLGMTFIIVSLVFIVAIPLIYWNINETKGQDLSELK